MARLLASTLLLAATILTLSIGHAGAADDPPRAGDREVPEVSFQTADGKVAMKVGAEVIGTYVFEDAVTTRPYLANLHAPGGVRVTRSHPPVEGRDPTDHADMHPGLWLAFADVGGLDVWRNKAKVQHLRFEGKPTGGPGRGTLTVVNRYTDGPKVACEETCRYTLLVRPAGYVLVADSVFRATGGELSFGDQEEMGFGVRVATPISVKSGGRIVDGHGRHNEIGVWGKPAPWVDYGGIIDGTRAGVMLVPDPANPHASRFHVRDYGLMVANPFGRKAFGERDEARTVVPKGESYRLRFAVLLHASAPDRELDRAAAYEDCLRHFKDEPRP